MRNRFVSPVLAALSAVCCQSPSDESRIGTQKASISSTVQETLPIPKPIPGGDVFPDSAHHRAGIIHQFYPVPPPYGDGPWAEPNGMTDFDGFVAQVFMGGEAVDNHGNHYIVDVDNRVYQGEYIGTNGEHAFGIFCEI